MEASEDVDLMKDGDHVIFKRGGDNLRIVQLLKDKVLYLEKGQNVKSNDFIGKPYGTIYEIRDNKLLILDAMPDAEVPNKDTDKDGNSSIQDISVETNDNRDLQDQDSNQKLTQDEIEQMKKDGVSGDHLIDKLIENSQTFEQKTGYAKAKWRMKKKKKHVFIFRALKPNIRLVCQMQWTKAHTKTGHLRYDTLAQMLTMANVRPHSKVLVVDTNYNILTAAVLDRLGGFGQCISFQAAIPVLMTHMPSYNFPDNIMRSLFPVPTSMINSLKLRTYASSHSQTDLTKPAVEKDMAERLAKRRRLEANTVNVQNVNVSLEAEADCTATSTASPAAVDDTDSPQTPVIDNVEKIQLQIEIEEDAADIKVKSENMETDSTEVKSTDSKQEKIESMETDTVEGLKSPHTSESMVQDTGDKTQTLADHEAQTQPDVRMGEDVSLVTNGEVSAKPYKEHRANWFSKPRKHKSKLYMEKKMAKEGRHLLEEGGADCLLVATKYHPTPIVLALLPFLAPSRQIVIYSQFKEVLEDCYVYMREHKGIVNYKLSDTWLREYQVLPNRTHPVIQMPGAGGYILTATTLVPPPPNKGTKAPKIPIPSGGSNGESTTKVSDRPTAEPTTETQATPSKNQTTEGENTPKADAQVLTKADAQVSPKADAQVSTTAEGPESQSTEDVSNNAAEESDK